MCQIEAAHLPKSRAQSVRRTPINTAIRRTARATLVAAACTSVLAVSLSACGAVKQLTAAQKVSDAFGKLGESKTFSVKLSIDATADQLMAYGKATGEKIEQKNADAVSGLSLAFAISADKPLKDLGSFKKANGSVDYNALTADKSLSFSYVLAGKGGKTLVELRQVGAKAYLQTDVAGLATLTGQDPAQVTAMSDELPPELKVFKDALAGRWIGIDPKTLQDFGKSAAAGAAKGGGAAGSAPSAQPSLDPKVAKDLGASLKDVFSRDVTFEDKGKQDGAERIVVSAPARRLADDLLASLKPVAKDVPRLGKLPSSASTDIPDRNVGVDVLVKDGTLSSIGLDLAQLDKKAGADVHLPLKITFGKDVPALQAPADATELTKADLDNIVPALMGAAPGGHPAGTPGHKPAKPLTDVQVKDLLASGMTQDDIKSATAAGLGYDDIKKVLSAGS